MYTEEDCIAALKEVAEQLGHSPTIREYNDEVIDGPCAGTIRNTFGSWDRAKERLDLEKCDSSKEYPKPDGIDRSDDWWENLGTSAKRKYMRRIFVAKYKLSKGCKKCGYDKRACALDCHHTGDKETSIGEMVTRVYSKEKIKNELEKCEVICSNCHRIEHEETIDLSG